MIIVVDYDSAWPQDFEALRARIWDALKDTAITVEHVGSTSVPGLAAKPVIDIDVVVARGNVSIAIDRLAGLGYRHQGDLGIVDREAFLSPLGSVNHHLYLCLPESLALANHLILRNYLRGHPSAAQAYGELKKRLAQEYAQDIDGYVQAKTGFILEILGKEGFDEPQLSEIERINCRLGTGPALRTPRSSVSTPRHSARSLSSPKRV